MRAESVFQAQMFCFFNAATMYFEIEYCLGVVLTLFIKQIVLFSSQRTPCSFHQSPSS